MNKSLPSLNSIRFFEAAARHLSFTRAAEEMFVTQGAVSKQIKMLEDQLDCQLFSRKGPTLSLTKDGEELLATVSSALETIQQGVSRIRRQRDTTLTLSVLPSFASIWLMPKVIDFEDNHPGISVRQNASFTVIDFSINTDIDAAIRLGKGDWPELYTRQLTRDLMFPVCNPDIASRVNGINDLGEQTLLVDPHSKIHTDDDPQLATDQKEFGEWLQWFKAAGVSPTINDYRVIDETGTLIRAAILGKGIALMRQELIADYLEAGLLVRLFDVEFYSHLHYFFVCPWDRKDEEKIYLFRHWLERVSD